MSLANLDLRQIARALGGEIGSGQVLAPGPGHSAADRSMSVKLDPGAPDGFVVHSFADDDPLVCKDYVREKCGAAATTKPNGSKRPRASREDIAALFAAAVQQHEREDSRPRSKPVATYDYTDDSGALLYQVLRYDHPKKFLQRRPDGNGGWTWKLEDRRVLYRLPELLKYPDGTVFFCEGEKDADRVAELGHCATTVASNKWTSECVAPLAGRDIIILQDNDAAGIKRALEAAKRLHGTAQTVRVVLLPDLPDGGDVSDWLDANPRRAKKLVDVCFGAPQWAPPAGEPINDQEAPCSPSPSPPPPSSSSSESSPPSPSPSSQGNETKRRLVATPYVWRDPATIPPRAWIYGWHYIRKFTSATIAPGALGKSSLDLTEAIAISLKLPLLGIMPMEQTNVWYWNGEDPAEETERRIAAICERYEIDGKTLEGRLFTNSGRLSPIKMAALKRGEIVFDANLVRDICDTIRENKIGVAIFDPFISVHDIPESDNTNIDAIAKRFGHIADETNVSIEFAHHVRKTGQAEITVEDARGASALIHAVRSARVLNRMTKEQAAEQKIEQPRFYFRSDNGKANLRPPEAAQWWHLCNIDLPNGDQVGVVETWKYPDPLDRITPTHMHAVRTMAAAGSYRKDARAEDWIGRAVAEVVDLDPDDPADVKTIKAALRAWFANGVLTTEERKDEGRKTRQFVVPGSWNETP